MLSKSENDCSSINDFIVMQSLILEPINDITCHVFRAKRIIDQQLNRMYSYYLKSFFRLNLIKEHFMPQHLCSFQISRKYISSIYSIIHYISINIILHIELLLIFNWYNNLCFFLCFHMNFDILLYLYYWIILFILIFN